MASIISAGTTSGTSLNLSGDTSGVLQLATNGTTTAVTIDTSQNVGIGTASPAQKLDVQAADYVAVRTLSTNSSIDTRLQSFSTGNYGYVGTVSNHAFSVITNNAERMRITSGGSVGIGTSSPNDKLDVNGTDAFIRIDRSNGEPGLTMRYNGSSTNRGDILVTSGGAMYFTSGGSTERMRINAGAPILCLAGGNTSATGTGIAFPATQSASSDANTLDDYEEGTWTPIYYGGSTAGTTTHTSQNGSYRKIGDTVFIECYIQWSTATGTGQSFIGGLPFTATGGLDTRSLTAIGAWNGYSITGTVFAIVSANTTFIELYALNNGSLSASNVSNAGAIRFEYFYKV
jgi:hypothetical protein